MNICKSRFDTQVNDDFTRTIICSKCLVNIKSWLYLYWVINYIGRYFYSKGSPNRAKFVAYNCDKSCQAPHTQLPNLIIVLKNRRKLNNPVAVSKMSIMHLLNNNFSKIGKILSNTNWQCKLWFKLTPDHSGNSIVTV